MMEFYNQTQVVVQCDPEDEEADDPPAAPFVDENPCLVCGHKAFANFIDISYSTSYTSSSNTHVKKRLKDILGKLWTGRPENQTLCLACFDLVDRFDSLESQLNTIRENIAEKFQKTSYKTTNGKPKISTSPSKKRVKTTSRSKKSPFKKFKPEESAEEDDNVFTVEICEGDNEYIAAEDSNQQNQTQELRPVPVTERDFAVAEPQEEEPPNPHVYDEHHELLQRGERIRLGSSALNEHGMESYLCGYCPQLWADIPSLHTHVHNYHAPEVVDVTIPPELGLGNTMNCGVEVQNCQIPPENPKPWSCLFCDMVFRARTNMSSHFKDKHTPYKPFSCTECGDAFRKGIDLNRHKLYFCSQRTLQFGPKRKYNKRRDFSKNTPSKAKIKANENSDMVSIEVPVPVS